MRKKVYLLGWKVVRSSEGVYRSSHVGALMYIQFEKTVPLPGLGPLCVFTNRVDAREFIKVNGLKRYATFKIFPCAYLPDKKHKFVFDGRYKSHISNLVTGKALAREVILLGWKFRRKRGKKDVPVSTYPNKVNIFC